MLVLRFGWFLLLALFFGVAVASIAPFAVAVLVWHCHHPPHLVSHAECSSLEGWVTK